MGSRLDRSMDRERQKFRTLTPAPLPSLPLSHSLPHPAAALLALLALLATPKVTKNVSPCFGGGFRLKITQCSKICMAARGRGRGRGGRGFGASFEHRFAKHEPYALFPENVNLPDISYITSVEKDYRRLIHYKLKFENFWKGSCYHLEESSKKSRIQGPDIERYLDKAKQKSQTKREALESYLKLLPSNFPSELIQGSKRNQRDKKKLRWDVDSDEKLFEKLEKLEEHNKEDEKDEKEKKGESDEEEEDQAEDIEEESSEEDDYNQNIEFDDDEDDLNMEEEEFEDAYE